MRVILGVIFLMVTLMSCSKIFLQHQSKNRDSAGKGVPVVEAALAKIIHIRQYLPVTGVAKSLRSVDVVSDVSGKVIKLLFKSGQYVHQGDLLVVLEHETVKAELEEAEAKLVYQEKNFHRYALLARKDLVAKDNLDNLASQLNQERAQIHRLRAEFEKCFIRAPFDGTLGIKQVSLGQYIQSNKNLVNLQRNHFILLDLAVPERYIKAISIGQSVKVKEDNAEFGKIVAFDSSINSQTHSLIVRVLVDNQYSSLIPGQFVTTYLSLADANVITVPVTAINYDLNGSTIFVIQNGRVHLQPVEVEIHDDYAVIKSGLKPGDTVVSAGQSKLYDGAKVKISAEVHHALH